MYIKIYSSFKEISLKRGNVSYTIPFALIHQIKQIAKQTVRSLSAVTLAILLASPSIANADYTSLQEAVADTTVSNKTYNLGADENVGADLGTLGEGNRTRNC